MCGIAGCLLRDPERVPARAVLERMAARLRHRGPDRLGVVRGPGGGLVVRRLRVIDPRPEADPPLENEDGTVAAVLNGELYEHATLRTRLEARGHAFRTRSDTEVLPHLWEEHGPTADLARGLRGMFAFAVRDRPGRTLCLARDPVGQKPLLVAETADGVWFASELPALLEVPSVRARARLDPDVLPAYLRLGWVPGPRTAVTGVERVRQGHLLVAREGRIVRRTRYVRPFGPPRPVRRTDPLREVGRGIDEAVRVRLEADVPLGVLLSGGVDSSLVAEAASRIAGRSIRTFAFDAADPTLSEGARAARVARAIGSDHETIRLETDPADVALEVLRGQDEPFADPSIVPTWLVARAAREQVTVVLTGDGGDELFGGYDRFRAALLRPLLAPLAPLGDPAARLLGHLPARARESRRVDRARRLLTCLDLPPRQAHEALLGLGSRAGRRALLKGLRTDRTGPRAPHRRAWSNQRARRDGRRPMYGRDAPPPRTAGPHPWHLAGWREAGGPLVHRLLAHDLHAYLEGDVLRKVDRATMAHGLEARSPLLDGPLVSRALRLPPDQKVRPFRTKILLRELAARRFPALDWEGPKQGFGAPVAAWLRGPLRDATRDLLLAPDARVRDHLDRKALRDLLEAHEADRANHARLIWAVLALETWLRAHGRAG